MYLPFDSIFGKIILFFAGVLFLSVLYYLYSFTYWWRRNVFYLKPSLLFGNYKDLLMGRQHTTKVTQQLHQTIKSKGHKFGGIYFLNTPVLLLTDTAIIKRILATDFEYFSDRGLYFHKEKDPLASNVFGLPTEPWRQLRNKLTPTFTSGKMKSIFENVLLCANGLVEVTEENLGQPIEINDLTVRYTVDTIGRTAYGIECNSLKNPEEKFKKIAELVKNPPVWSGTKFVMALMSSTFLKLFNLRVIQKQITKFFLDVVEQNIELRESNNIQRNDFFQLLLDIKHKDEKLEDNSIMKMTPRLMAAQTFVFFAAGFDTSAMTIDLCLFELSRNLDMQDKVRAEIKKVMKEHGGKLTYDGLKEMVYLGQCMQETLRKYPPLGFLNRECVKNYKIPDSDVVIEKGTKVMISVQGLQNDPEYFPNPDKFDPDRFSPANKEKIAPYTHMPFGEGHRVCIGMRFGTMQSKVGLAAMLSKFEFTLIPMTKLPFVYTPQSFVISIKDGIFFNVKKVVD